MIGHPLELHRVGTVTYIPIEEGFYGIVSDNGDSYKNLYPISPFGYETDGLRVSFIAATREDYYSILPASILQWGVPIEILSITSQGVPAEGEEGEVPVIPEVPKSPEWYKNPWLWVGVGGFILLAGGFGKVRKKK